MKKTLSLIMVFTLILTLMVPAMGASILTATASANPTRYLDFNPMNSGDVTKGFMNIGGNTMTMVNGKLEVVPGGAGTGLYYGPASEYGGPGNGKIYNGLLSFNYAVDFKAGANDWGSTIQFRTNNANPPWAMSSGFYLLIRPDMIILYKVGGVLDVVYKPLVNLAEYSFRISFTDNASGNCDIKVTIKDSNNQLYQNDGSTTGYSLVADNVAGSAVAGYVTLFGNNAQINKYTVSPGTTETFSQATPYNFSNLAASDWFVDTTDGYLADNGKISITTSNSNALAAIRFKGDGSPLKNNFTNTEYNLRIKMKYKQTAVDGDWGLLACFAAKDPNSAPWVASGQECYTFHMNKANNLLMKTTEGFANTAFTPSKTSSSGVINDNLFHNIKITTVQNSYNDLSKITVSVDGIELYNFVDVAPLKAGGFFLLTQNSKLDVFELDTQNQITDFRFNDFNPAVTGVITGTNITATVPSGTSVQNLVSTFTAPLNSAVTVNGVSQISGVTANDFTNPIVYTIADENGGTSNYTVIITVDQPVQEVFSLPSVFADNMVLQRNAIVKFWGTGISGSTITASIAGKSAFTTTLSGTFSVSLNDLPVGGPYTLSVSDGTTIKTYNNVLVGDVWVLAGQSNMEMRVGSLTNKDSYISSANYPNIRQFIQERAYSATPKGEVVSGQWDTCSPQTVANFSAVGYFFSKTLYINNPDVPVGIIYTPYGGTPARCWMPRASTDKLGITNDIANNPWEAANVTYNAMVNPILQFAPKGVLWYQGEGQPVRYGEYLNEIISSWREGFSNAQLPFLVIQLPRYGTSNTGGWPISREYQDIVTQTISNTALSVNIDLGEAANIHPNDKEPVGVRAANVAMAKFYGVQGNIISPSISASIIDGNKIYADFKDTGNGLEIRNNGVGFEICGSDMVYKPATVSLLTSSRIQLTSTEIANPVAIRYAWSDFPQVSLYNIEGYPAAPFRTEKDITAFSFIGLSQPAEVRINGVHIEAVVPYGTNATSLVANFTTASNNVKLNFGTNVQISGDTQNNFTNLVAYNVFSTDGTGKDYYVKVIVKPINISSFDVSSTNILTKVLPLTSTLSFKNILNPINGANVSFKNAGNSSLSIDESTKIGTGTSVMATTADGYAFSYKVVIYGDVDGDGDISINDLADVKRHLLKIETLNNDFLTAGDIYRKGSIGISDLLAVKKQLLNLADIIQ